MFIPLLFVHYLMVRIYQLMNILKLPDHLKSLVKSVENVHLVDEESANQKVTKVQSCCRNPGCSYTIECLDYGIVWVLKGIGFLVGFFLTEILHLEWNERVQEYFYAFFLQTFARYAFTLVMQLTFDYATLSYLGHNGPNFSEEYIRSDGRNGTQNIGPNAYITSVARVYKWRSQTYCFLQESLEGLHLVEILSFT